jgi:RsmE family RNA methyltransferase
VIECSVSLGIKKIFITGGYRVEKSFWTSPFLTKEKPCPSSIKSPFTLAIGPEGGFIQYEVELFKKQGFQCISYGERVLRVEYAVPGLVCRFY